jgi:hypothetical protein
MFCRFTIVALCVLLVAQSLFASQEAVGLRIQVVQGEDARNVLEQIPANPITVRVTDRNNRPIPGASVTFTSPTSGPSGDFVNGLTNFTTMTDENGTAVAREYRPNDVAGAYQIRVRAEYLGEIATTSIHQTNGATKKSTGKLIAIVAVAGIAGVAGAAFAARGGGSSSSPTTPTSPNSPSVPTISFGGATVSGPK